MEEESACECEEGAPAWMATFSDLCTLLLTFFVLLLSFANMDVKQFRVALGSVKDALGVTFKVDGDFEGMATSAVEINDTPSVEASNTEGTSPKGRVKAKVMRYIRQQNAQDLIEVAETERGVVLRVTDTVLFDTGSDRLRKDSSKVIAVVVGLFGKFKGQLSIEGHTDDRPISSTRFPSNWELSTARSIAVLRELVDQQHVAASRLKVAGYADKQPLDTANTAAARGKNRRVEFIFENPPQFQNDPAAAYTLP
ncbi:MAG: flagellar motor protein MotB [Polyangiaceae bacterium]|nr:flagellar motor protein MotB [Myxococcales bacterium]MCB9587248.1 flagellar motor protein MotB [Polyangiaceae bacterium]MCB9609369.1 flagellar motor protein MotB [Polyangiaceae bacterium]